MQIQTLNYSPSNYLPSTLHLKNNQPSKLAGYDLSFNHLQHISLPKSTGLNFYIRQSYESLSSALNVQGCLSCSYKIKLGSTVED